MTSPRASLPLLGLASALVAAGCSGPGGYATPPLEPDVEVMAAPAAQNDTRDCVEQGAEITLSEGDPAPVCCEGLTLVDAFKGSILRLDTCEREEGGHAFCIRCGDGICGVGENTCSCAADCRWP